MAQTGKGKKAGKGKQSPKVVAIVAAPKGKGKGPGKKSHPKGVKRPPRLATGFGGGAYQGPQSKYVEPLKQPMINLREDASQVIESIPIITDMDNLAYNLLWASVVSAVTDSAEQMNNSAILSTWFYWLEILADAAAGRVVSGLVPRIIADVAASLRPKMVKKDGFVYVYSMTTHCASRSDPNPWAYPIPASGSNATFPNPISPGLSPTAGYFPRITSPTGYLQQDMQGFHTQFADVLQTVDLSVYKSPYINDPSVFAFVGGQQPTTQSTPLIQYWSQSFPFYSRCEVKIKSPWLAGLQLVSRGGTRMASYSAEILSDPGSIVWAYHKWGNHKREWRARGMPDIHKIVVKPVYVDDIAARFQKAMDQMVALNATGTPVSGMTKDALAKILVNYIGVINTRIGSCGFGVTYCDQQDQTKYVFRLPSGFGNSPIQITDLKVPKFLCDNVARMIPKVVGKGKSARLLVPMAVFSTASGAPTDLRNFMSPGWASATDSTYLTPSYANNFYLWNTASTDRQAWIKWMNSLVGFMHITEAPKRVSAATSIVDVTLCCVAGSLYTVLGADTPPHDVLEIARHFALPLVYYKDYTESMRFAVFAGENTFRQCLVDNMTLGELQGSAAMFAYKGGVLPDWDTSFLVPDSTPLTGRAGQAAGGARVNDLEYVTNVGNKTRIERMEANYGRSAIDKMMDAMGLGAIAAWGGGTLMRARPPLLPNVARSTPPGPPSGTDDEYTVERLVSDLRSRNVLDRDVVQKIVDEIGKEDKPDLNRIKWLLSWFPMLRYGKYGGPGYTAGTTEPPTLLPGQIWRVPPTDDLDRLFLVHDVQYSKAGDDTLRLIRADKELVDGIQKLENPGLFGKLAQYYFQWRVMNA